MGIECVEVMPEDLRQMKITIEEIHNACYEIDDGDEFNPKAWVPSTKPRELKAQFRKATVRKLAQQEAEVARIKNDIARKEAKKAAAEEKVLNAIRGVKRKSESDPPDWAKQEEKKKIKQVEESSAGYEV